MQDMVNKLYELLHTPLVTPYNLLENSKISNYNYVKYYKGSDGLICEMECESYGEVEKYFYSFDQKDFLQKIERDNSNREREVLFDRIVEVKLQKEKYSNLRKNQSVAL